MPRMISARMAWPVKSSLVCTALLVCAAAIAGCASFGTEKITVAKSDPALYHGAVLFNQRCSGCHTLSYAATHGSAANVQTAEYNNGPNFDQRCERPVTRVLYAIENGGFSGAIMPQNVVVGQDAIDVAKFVSTYSGRKAPKVPGVPACLKEPVGAIPSATGSGAATATAQASTVSGKSSSKAGGKAQPSKPSKGKGKRKGKRPSNK
jgi:mono/diheme cytochrome c family protein